MRVEEEARVETVGCDAIDTWAGICSPDARAIETSSANARIGGSYCTILGISFT